MLTSFMFVLGLVLGMILMWLLSTFRQLLQMYRLAELVLLLLMWEQIGE